MNQDQQAPEGVALTNVNITAASPDVINTFLKRITDEVMAAIPADTTQKMAQELLDGKKVVRPQGYGKDQVWTMAGRAEDRIKDMFEEQLEKAIGAIRADDLIQQAVMKIANDTAVTFISEVLPKMMANKMYATFSNMYGWQDTGSADWVQECVMRNQQNINNIVQELNTRDVYPAMT